MIPLIFIFLLVAFAAVFMLIFGSWTIVSVPRFLFGAIVGGRRFESGAAQPMLPGIRCPRAGCNADNPPAARFCRRCGVELANQARSVSRVAMW